MADALCPPLLPALLDPPDRPALAFPDGALTYAELADRAGALAREIAGLNRVAVWATSTLPTAVGIVAALLAGVPAVPINPRSGRRELEHVVADAAPDVVLAAPDVRLPDTLARLRRILVPRESDKAVRRRPASRGRLGHGVAALNCSGSSSGRMRSFDPSEPALVIYTSGTTGPPKGAVLSRGAIAANLDALADAWAWTAADVLVHALPLFHVHGLVLGVLGPLRRGGALRHLGAFSTAALTEALDGGGTLVFGVPTHYHRLADDLAGDPEAAAAVGRARLLVSGSAALTAVDHARLHRLTGLGVRERYGLTETLILTAARADEPVEPGTVGQPTAGTEVRLAPLDGGDELGVVEVRGPSLFSGYLNRPDATATATTADGWFVTGDIGRWTPSGALALVGRKATDLIKSGGFKIGAGEIENALLEHPAVAEAAVVGVPDDDLGERVVAYVVLDGGVATGEADGGALTEHVAGLLAPHKRPREVRFVDALPRNDMGKVVKARLPR
jgi:malonyl-CoA/methylmalonyl-CoA synthetase